MKKIFLTAVACLALPAAAFAAEPPANPEKCCCEKMKKEDGKGCCAEKDKAEHDTHADHKMGAPKA